MFNLYLSTRINVRLKTITKHVDFSTLFSLTLKEDNYPDILDLSLWRLILTGGLGNQTLCQVPLEYQQIMNAYCHAHNRGDCLQVPCTMLYHSEEFRKTFQCLKGGKAAIEVKPDWICRKSPAIELLNNQKQKPSILAEGFSPMTTEFYVRALATHRDNLTKTWGFMLEGESIGYYPSIAKQTRLMSLFDITIGYDRRYFDLVTHTHFHGYIDSILNRSNKRLTIEQVWENKILNQSHILWINSNCDAPSNRTNYMLELMRYIRVNARGRCGNPNYTQSAISSDPKVLIKEKMKLSSEHFFTVAIENSLEYDYVTEKLWQPLAAGSVPLYLGAPNIDEWLPCYNYSCIIDLRQFKSMQELAKFLNELVEDKERYLSYHRWRNESSMRNSFVRMVKYLEEANKHTLECLLCDMAHRKDEGEIRRKLLTANNQFDHDFPSLI